MTAYRSFAIKNVQAENAVKFSKTSYQLTADDALQWPVASKFAGYKLTGLSMLEVYRKLKTNRKQSPNQTQGSTSGYLGQPATGTDRQSCERLLRVTEGLTYRTRTTQTPTYLASLIHPYTPSRTLRSSDQLLLTAPRVTLALSAKAFSVNAPAVWNSLSLSLSQKVKVWALYLCIRTHTTGLDTVAKRLRFACD